MTLPTQLKIALTTSAAAAAAFGLLVQVPTASAGTPAPAKATTCKIDVDLKFMPGLGLKEGAASFYSRGGKVSCDGPVNGVAVTGPGRYSSAGRIGTTDPDSCSTGGEGWGVLRAVFPTAKGKWELRSAFTFVYGALKSDSPINGTTEGDYFEGKFAFLPIKGDCVTAPVTLSRTTATVTMHPFEAAA